MALTDEQLLQLARDGAVRRIADLRDEIAALEALMSGNRMRRHVARMAGRAAAAPAVRRRRRLSPAGRARIAAAQKARWAKIKQAKAGATEAKPSAGAAKRARKRRGMSPTQRAAVSRRMKAYWAKRRRSAKPKK